MSVDYDKHCELEAVRAIYPDLIANTSRIGHIIVIWKNGTVQVHIVEQANEILPTFEIVAPTLSKSAKKQLFKKLIIVCEENWNEPKLHCLVKAISDFGNYELNGKSDAESDYDDDDATIGSASLSKDSFNKSLVKRLAIHSGRVFEDRKSIFQAHVSLISSKEEAMRVLSQLKENSKIARATHNIYAYRVRTTLANGRVVEQQDCECDGETGAGPKLLKLLHLMKAINMIVIVTRWYGGIHLGPDRFRHISNLAREVILHEQKSSAVCLGYL